MTWRTFSFSIMWLFLVPPLGYSQPNLCPCDYFLASQNVDRERYLRQAEQFHIKPVPNSIREGNLTLAFADLNYVLERFPNHPQGLQLMTVVAQLRKQPTLAVSYFEKAIQGFPQHALTQAQYGLFLVTIGSMEKGLEMLEKATETDPKLPAGYAGLAHAYAKKGDLPKAREASQKARELGFKGQLPIGQ